MSASTQFGRRGTKVYDTKQCSTPAAKKSYLLLYLCFAAAVPFVAYAVINWVAANIEYQRQIEEAARKSEMEKQAVRAALEARLVLMEAVKKHAASMLKNPDSAKFGDVWFVDTRTGPVVCGYINGTNGFGGYAGQTPFVYTGGWTYFLKSGEDSAPAGKAAWADHCEH